MSRSEIFQSLNKVFDLMMENKFRENMDDTLLEKLLSVIKFEISEDNTNKKGSEEKLSIIQDLFLNTQVLQLVEKVIISLNERTSKLSQSIQKFAIELIGVLFGNKNVFILYKDSIILREMSNALKKDMIAAYPPTVQSAILLYCINITKHFEGIIWFKEQNLMQFVFSSFSSSSYHVRAKAVSFFTEVLNLWTPSSISTLLTQEQLLVNDFFRSIVLDLISRIQIDGMKQENNTIDCCILALQNSFEVANVRKLVNSSSVLQQQLLHYFESLANGDFVDEKVLNLLLCVFISGGVSELFIQDILKLLISHLLLVPALSLTGSILRDSKQNKPISKDQIQFLTLPLKILAGNSLQKDLDVVFGLSCSEIYDYISKAIENKADCIKIIISSLLSLSKLISFMNLEALEDILISISIVVTGPTCCQHHPMSYVCLENRNICFALSELFSSLLNENVYGSLNFHNQLNVTNYLMHFLEKAFDYNVATETLRLLEKVISLNDNFSVSLPDDTKAKIIHLLCKKLVDKRETIVISALSVACLIMSKDENNFWKDIVLEQNLHQIVWEMGVIGIQDGILKAALLQATLQACKNPCFWRDFESAKKVNEEDVMLIFFGYYRDPDFYVQRESLACIFQWLKDRESVLPLTCKDPLLIILSEAVKSLDMEQKDTALKMWTWLIESDKFFPEATKSAHSLLETVCKSGFASSLVLAVEDYDEVIQYKAAKILIKFQETLLKMGWTSNDSEVDDLKSLLPQTRLEPELNFKSISKEERDCGIENVIKLTTAEQIAKLAVSPENSSDSNSTESVDVQVDSLAFPVNSFLKYLWSSNLDGIVSKPTTSMDLFSEHTLSLLEDIIASDETDFCRPLNDIPDCY